MSSCFMRSNKKKEDNTLDNGAILLKELIASCNGKCNLICSFSAQELKIATNNYEERCVIKFYGDFKLYSGSLEERPIFVMKFLAKPYLREEVALQWSFKNIIFASQMCHKIFLTLIGCCLETRIPILVFESVEHEVLGNFIHRESHLQPLLLTQRLKITMEVANALSYLHIGFPRPIVFKGLHPQSILLDEQYVVKLLDFSLSETIPEGETHIKDDYDLIGTYGYMAPEFVHGWDYNEKYDVYSFGVLMLELLTAQRISNLDYKIDDWEQYDGQEPYPSWVVNYCIRENELNKIVDPVFIRDGTYPEKEQQLLAFAELAHKCLSESSDERPTMMDVAKQLRQMYRSSM